MPSEKKKQLYYLTVALDLKNQYSFKGKTARVITSCHNIMPRVNGL